MGLMEKNYFREKGRDPSAGIAGGTNTVGPFSPLQPTLLSTLFHVAIWAVVAFVAYLTWYWWDTSKQVQPQPSNKPTAAVPGIWPQPLPLAGVIVVNAEMINTQHTVQATAEQLAMRARCRGIEQAVERNEADARRPHSVPYKEHLRQEKLALQEEGDRLQC